VTNDRERLTAQLHEHGDRRRAARDVDRKELDAIAELLPQALRAGISKREVVRLTGVSRTWIDELLRRGEASRPEGLDVRRHR
jgi:DNA invertase Pin-like site-specific DNA recombinase